VVGGRRDVVFLAHQDQLLELGHAYENDAQGAQSLGHHRQERCQTPGGHDDAGHVGVGGAAGDGDDRGRQELGEGGMRCHRHDVHQ
jgi:hypothetical protein